MVVDVPILFVIFKRPQETQEVFNIIRKIKPRKLYIAADGPRNDHQGEKEDCSITRKVVKNVDWDCKVYKNFSEENLGLRKRMSSAISWLFMHETKGIILEDDCIPDKSFFGFCNELLELYEDDERIMAIAGDNFQQGKRRTDNSYYFSRYPHCWGWATWRRAWKYYDDGMQLWPQLKREGWLSDILKGDKLAELYWTNIFDLVYEGKINSWAYRWQYSCWIQNGLTILPSVNLVTNVGFGKQATNTKFQDNKAMVKSDSLTFPLRYPPYIIRDTKADRRTEWNRFLTPRIVGGMIYRKLINLI